MCSCLSKVPEAPFEVRLRALEGRFLRELKKPLKGSDKIEVREWLGETEEPNVLHDEGPKKAKE